MQASELRDHARRLSLHGNPTNWRIGEALEAVASAEETGKRITMHDAAILQLWKQVRTTDAARLAAEQRVVALTTAIDTVLKRWGEANRQTKMPVQDWFTGAGGMAELILLTDGKG